MTLRVNRGVVVVFRGQGGEILVKFWDFVGGGNFVFSFLFFWGDKREKG